MAMIFPCPNKITCPGTDSPYANLSSEAPDQITYPSFVSVPYEPRLREFWKSPTCFGLAVSYVSQADADEQANFVADLCQPTVPPGDVPGAEPPGGGGGNNPIPDPTYYNSPQTCAYICPDGSPFNYSLHAGLFSAPTQQGADIKAHTYACHQGASHRVCLPSLPPSACIGTAYSQTLNTNPPSDVHWVQISGTLPPGLSLTDNVLAGTPTTLGVYTFVLRATDALGSYMTKTYTVRVLEIQESAELEDGSVGLLYTYTLTGDSQGIPIIWRVSQGQLPPGLVLDEATGEIFGTPTTAGTFNFTICMATL